jgi:hypothetical protein
VISLVMALLSFVESAPRAYRLKVGNADLFRNSTKPGTSPLPPEPEWRGVSGLRIVIPHGRPDVMLVEIKTLYGPVRLSMPRSIALKVGRSIAEEAEKLAPDRSLS